MYKAIVSEIERAFRVLGEEGYFQNLVDLKGWKEEGYINDDEYEKLKEYNKKVRKQYA